MGNFKNNLLDYCKHILIKVSFSRQLFWKEYRKSIKMLSDSESHILKFWMIRRFSLRGRIATKLIEEADYNYRKFKKHGE